jgi:hypothetical protein
MAGDGGIALRLRICEDAVAHLRALNDSSVEPLIRDIEALAEKLRSQLRDPSASANRSVNPS